MNESPILSICIPTWNRCNFLKCSLERLLSQIKEIQPADLEIIVSDNASEDETALVVKDFIERGLPISYNRNMENLGADGNFLKCMQIAKGKYIFLVGDDDYFRPGALHYIVETIKKGDYGLVHLHEFGKFNNSECIVYDDVNLFLNQVSIWITFMSGNIFLREAYDKIDNPQMYMKTNLLQMPFYIQAAFMRKENIIINKTLFDYSLDGDSNGGYNFYQVFLDNYLTIWDSFVKKNYLPHRYFEKLKKKLLFGMLLEPNWYLLCLKRNVSTNNSTQEFRRGFKTEGAWKMLFHYYGKNLYFYFSLLIMPFVATYRRLATKILSK